MSVGRQRVTPVARIRSSASLDAIGRQVGRVEIDAAEAVDLQVEQPRQLESHDWSLSRISPRVAGSSSAADSRSRYSVVSRVRLQDRRRRHRRHLAFDARLDRLRLARVGHHADDLARLQNLAHRHRDGLRRDVRDRAEPAFADLLPAARVVERDDEVRLLGVEIGRGIVERQVAVFADPDKRDVDRRCWRASRPTRSATRAASRSPSSR